MPKTQFLEREKDSRSLLVHLGQVCLEGGDISTSNLSIDSLLPATTQCTIKLHDREKFVAFDLGETEFGVEKVTIGI